MADDKMKMNMPAKPAHSTGVIKTMPLRVNDQPAQTPIAAPGVALPIGGGGNEGPSSPKGEERGSLNLRTVDFKLLLTVAVANGLLTRSTSWTADQLAKETRKFVDALIKEALS